MPQPLLHIKDLCIDFAGKTGVVNALQHVNLEIKRGEIVAIVGESGSGKSVTALSILQLLPSPPAVYRHGEILFSRKGNHSVNLMNLSSDEMRNIRGNEIAMIFQEPMTSLNPVFTCGQQVMEAIQLHQKIPVKPARLKAEELFEKVKLPDPSVLFRRYPHQLSGGQKQRVMIAMAMSCNPSLLIADEPTTALDVTVQKTILLLIKELQQQFNMGVIFITHDLGVVAELADRVVVMYKGKMVEQGTVTDLFQSAKNPYTKSLLACRPLLYKKGERLPVVSDFMRITDDGEIEEKQVKHAVVTEHAKENLAVTPIKESSSPLITVEDLHIWFPAKKNLVGMPLQYTRAVNGISFEVYEGETLGLVGESGCGKTTLGRALLQLIKPTKGKVLFKGQELTGYSPALLRTMRRNMQIVFQDPYSSLNPSMTVGSAILEPLMIHGIFINEMAGKKSVIDLLEKVNLKAEHYYRYPHEFSGGQRQRIVIARSLALNPSFIIFDESVSSLDISVQAQVLNLLNDLKSEFKFTAIFISHDLSVVRYVSDRILVMNKGRIEESGVAEQIYHHPQSEYTQNLIRSIPKTMLED
ncbi:MAG: ABC transporter ATP-binding protein [Chitinophagaceae bacterium]